MSKKFQPVEYETYKDVTYAAKDMKYGFVFAYGDNDDFMTYIDGAPCKWVDGQWVPHTLHREHDLWRRVQPTAEDMALYAFRDEQDKLGRINALPDTKSTPQPGGIKPRVLELQVVAASQYKEFVSGRYSRLLELDSLENDTFLRVGSGQALLYKMIAGKLHYAIPTTSELRWEKSNVGVDTLNCGYWFKVPQLDKKIHIPVKVVQIIDNATDSMIGAGVEHVKGFCAMYLNSSGASGPLPYASVDDWNMALVRIEAHGVLWHALK